MSRLLRYVLAAALSSFFILNSSFAQAPCLKSSGSALQLVVDGKPMLLRTGELGNSSSSTMDYARESFAKARSLGMNCAIASIQWDQFEPVEGKYCYDEIDGLIREAENERLKLVVIWFATFKNGASSYAPEWVKKDLQRFPRVKGLPIEALQGGEDQTIYTKNILSPFFEATWKADAKAFAALMKHIKKVDRQHTVVMMQVENEAGTYGVDIDRQPVAQELFAKPVPTALISYLAAHENTLQYDLKAAWDKGKKQTGQNWTEVFGDKAIDAFMCWHIASYMEQVTKAGKAEYPIPMYYNAWLLQPKYEGKPGRYPTGGPIHTMMDVYRAASPSIDFLAPDIYHPEFKQYCAAYRHNGNPLFIPECRLDDELGGKAYWAFAEDAAIGFAPFGIERLHEADSTVLTNAYRVLEQLEPLVLERQGTPRLRAFYRQVPPKRNVNVGEWQFDAGELGTKDPNEYSYTYGDYIIRLQYYSNKKNAPSFAMLLQLADDEFIVTGQNIQVKLESTRPNEAVELIYAQQGEYIDGQWKPRRWLNGDETAHGKFFSLPTSIDAFRPADRQDIVRFKLYSYPTQ